MKILIHGLQNSGATLFAFFVGQNPESLVIPDLWSMYCAPIWNSTKDICVKTTVTTSFSVQDHKENFKPDLTILVIRHPEDNYSSLINKSFKNDDGLMEEKFAILDKNFDNNDIYDYIVRFEEFILDPEKIRQDLCSLGWNIPPEASYLNRTPHDMEMAVWRSSPELYDNIKWGTGNSRSMPIKDIRLVRTNNHNARNFAWRYAPRLSEAYKNKPPNNIFSSKNANVDHKLFRKNVKLAKQSGFINLLYSNIMIEQEITSNNKIEGQIKNCIFAAYYHCRLSSMSNNIDYKQIVRLIIDFINENDNPDLRILLAKYFFDISEFEIAKNIISNIHIEKENYYKNCYLISEIMIKTGDIREAENIMRYHLTFEPRSAFANYRLAELLLHHGDIKEAEELLKFCIALDKDFIAAKKMLQNIINQSH